MGSIFGRIGEDIVTGGAAEIFRAANGGEGLVDEAGNLIGDAGEGMKDLANVGKNRFDPTAYDPGETPDLGMGASTAWGHMGDNRQDIDAARGYGGFAGDEMMWDRGPMARETQALSDREAMASGGDMSGALQLAREGAMGMAPSAAAYQMQQGLNDATATQSAIAGSARGSAALANAQGNSAANVANLQQNAFSEGGRLRAAEMQNYANLYGGLAGQNVNQAQNRMQMGNQMSQYNAGLNDQYRLGMGGLGVQYGQLGNELEKTNQGYFGQGVGIAGKAADLEAQHQGLTSQNYNEAQGTRAGIKQQNADIEARNKDRALATASTVVQGAGDYIPKPGGGGK